MPIDSCLLERLVSGKPTGGTPFVDHYGIITARAPEYWGIADNIVLNGGDIAEWPSETGTGKLEQTTADQQPLYVSGTAAVIGGNPYAEFNGTEDAFAARMLPNGIADIPITDPFTIIMVLNSGALDKNRFITGQTGAGNESIAMYYSSTLSGSINFKYGPTVFAQAISVDNWYVVMFAYDGSLGGKFQVNGTENSASVGGVPTTSKAFSLGCNSSGSQTGTIVGDVAEVMFFLEDITTDTTFMGVLNEYFREKFSFVADVLTTS